MVSFWKRRDRDVVAKTVQAEAVVAPPLLMLSEVTQLSEAAMVELINCAEVVRFADGDDLLATTPGLASGYMLLQAGAIRVYPAATEEAISLEVTTAFNLIGAEGTGLPGFCISAGADGQLLLLSAEQFSQLRESTRLVLMQMAQHSAAERFLQLLEHYRRAQQRYERLSSVLFTSAAGAAESFAASEPVQGIIARIPKLPVSSVALLNRLLDDNSTHAQVAELVRQDPSLTATLLKAINSSRYSFDQKITDLSHAVSLLGFEGVYQVIMAESLRKSLPDTEQFRASYQRALLLSYLAFALAQAGGKARPAEMATIALLHDVGRVVLELLQRQSPAFRPMIAQVHPGVVGAELLKAWRLPEPVWSSIALQHYPDFVQPGRLPAAVQMPVALLHLSAWLLDSREQADGDEPLFLDEYLALLGWAGEPAELIWERRVRPLLHQRRNALPKAMQQMLVENH